MQENHAIKRAEKKLARARRRSERIAVDTRINDAPTPVPSTLEEASETLAREAGVNTERRSRRKRITTRLLNS